MKNQIKLLLIIFCLVILPFWSVAQQEVKTINKTFDVFFDVNLMVNNKYGIIEISSFPENKIELEVKIKAKGEGSKEFIENVNINIFENRSTIKLETQYPEMEKKKNFSFNVDYKIKVPVGTKLKIENEFGDVLISNIHGGIETDLKYCNLALRDCFCKIIANNKFGYISASNIEGNSIFENSHNFILIERAKGDLEVKNSFGDIKVFNVNGNLMLEDRNGRVNIGNIGGRVDLNNQFGDIQMNEIKGIVEINSRNSNINAVNIQGGRITNSFGSINIIGSRGNNGLTITNNNGKVYVYDCKNNIILKNSFDYIELLYILGRIDIISNNSEIKLNQISGDINIENSFGGVDLSRSKGDVNIRNSNGNIYLNQIEKLSSMYNLTAQFGSIQTSLPSNFSGKIDAITSYGNIVSDFPLQFANSNSFNQKSASAKIGNNSTQVILQCTNGGIKIKREEDTLIFSLKVPLDAEKNVSTQKKDTLFITASKISNKDNSNQNEKVIYITIKTGESLSSIARKYKVTVNDIKNENKGKLFKPGIILKIVPKNNSKSNSETNDYRIISHTIKKGETMSSIARKYNVPVSEIKNYTKEFKSGGVLKIKILKKYERL